LTALQVVGINSAVSNRHKKPALAYAKSGYKIPSSANIYKAPCKLSSNQRLSSVTKQKKRTQPMSEYALI
jgi:hypothetical protein